jgi:hypothetical protein
MHNPLFKNRRHQIMCYMSEIGERGITLAEALHDKRFNGINPKTLNSALNDLLGLGHLRRELLSEEEKRALAKEFNMKAASLAYRYYFASMYTPSHKTGVDKKHRPRMYKAVTLSGGRLSVQAERIDGTPCGSSGVYFRTQEDAVEFAKFILENIEDIVPPVSTRSKQPKTPIGTSLKIHRSTETTFVVGSVVPKGKKPIYRGLIGKVGPDKKRGKK